MKEDESYTCLQLMEEQIDHLESGGVLQISSRRVSVQLMKPKDTTAETI